jgi:hypothetical protein
MGKPQSRLEACRQITPLEGRVKWQRDVTEEGTKKSGLAVLARAGRVMYAAEVPV